MSSFVDNVKSGISAALTHSRESLSQAQSAQEQLRENLEAVRASIRQAQISLLEIENAAATPEETLRRMAIWAHGVSAEAQKRLPSVGHFASGQYPKASGRSPPAASDLVVVFGWPVVFEGMKAAVAKHFSGKEGLSEELREARREVIADELLKLEMVEESIIRSAESGGMSITRRPDAAELVVMATDESLNAALSQK